MSNDIYDDIDGEEFRDEISEYPDLQRMWEDQEGDLQGFFQRLSGVLWQSDMLAATLSAEPMQNQHIAQFSHLLAHDFVELCRNNPCPTDVASARELAAIRDAMKSIAAFPELYTKRIGAVGGGYSSGKSAFINSFLASRKLRLAEGIRPVTAIPSYVLRDEQNCGVTGVNHWNGRFPISSELYGRLSHSELKKADFNLKYLIDYIAVKAPLEAQFFSHLCLLDTPGYNPPQSGTERDDRKTASVWLEKAGFLIWVVGLDVNGTLSESDIKFLDNFSFGKNAAKELYVVCNKSDLRPKSDVKDILKSVRDVLDANCFAWQGITAYSSSEKKAAAYIRQDIYAFLEKHNTPVNVHDEFQRRIDAAFNNFFVWIDDECDRSKAIVRKLKSLELMALEAGAIGLSDANSELETGLVELMDSFRCGRPREARLKQASEIKQKFKDTFEKFCAGLGVGVKKRRFCGNCGKEVDQSSHSCPYCQQPL